MLRYCSAWGSDATYFRGTRLGERKHILTCDEPSLEGEIQKVENATFNINGATYEKKNLQLLSVNTKFSVGKQV